MFLTMNAPVRLLPSLRVLKSVQTNTLNSTSLLFTKVRFDYLCQNRRYSSEKKKDSLTKVHLKEGAPTTYEQVKETSKTVSYLGVILVGVGVTSVLLYAIFRELFSSKSPNSVYAKALEKCCNEPRIIDSLGEPLKGFGEETRRGRRRHVSHLFYEKDGVNYLRMKFYIQGSRNRGTVHLEMRENDKGKFEYRYLFVQLEDYPRNTIIIEDNRYDKSSSFSSSKEFETA